MPGRPANLDASKAVERILEVPASEVDRSMGDVHPEGNPHYTCDPRNGVRVASWMALEFGNLNQKLADRFLANAETFSAEMQGLIAGWEKQASSLKGTKVIAYHE